MVTGPPGVGKSTLVSKVILRMRSAGVIVGGVTTAEARVKGVRVGFEIRDLTEGGRGELASTESKLGPRVGRYRVNLRDLETVGAKALEGAASRSELIVIDELGPMEIVSPEFRKAVTKCLQSGKPILAVVHERMEDDLLNLVRGSATATYSLTVENRDQLTEEVGGALIRATLGTRGGVRG